MKRILLLAMLFATLGQGYAQKKLQPGVRAGLNISSITNGNGNSKSDFYLGVQLPINFNKFYTLQPELEYSRQGAKDVTLNYNYDNWWGNSKKEAFKGDITLSYIEVKAMSKFRFNKFNLQAGPGLGFQVEGNSYTDFDVDFTITVGVGYDITDKLGVEVRYKAGVISVVDNYWKWDNDYNNNSNYRDNQHNSVFQIGLTYTF